MRGSVKRLAEFFLVTVLPLARRRAGLRGRALVLAFHNVVPAADSAGLDRSLHLPLDRFISQLDALSRTHRFVALDQILELDRMEDPRPLVAITFDDAYRGAVRHAIPVLADRGIPCTVFVVPGRLGAPGMWWDTLAGRSGDTLSADEREQALGQGHGMEEEVRKLGAGLGWSTVGVSRDAGLADVEEIRGMLAIPGVTIGSHTWSHPNLTGLSDAEVISELASAQEWVRAETGACFRPWLAYPYGLADSRVAGIARATGHSAAFRVSGGWTERPPIDPFVAARLNVPAGLSANGIRLRGAGLFC